MKRKAFTLIELMVVMSIVSALMAILLPALSTARQQVRGIVCRSNLRQLIIAAFSYCTDNDDFFPPASVTEQAGSSYSIREWDFEKIFEIGILKSVEPGLLWGYKTNEAVQQCPSFDGSAMSPGDPYTGYNYNASYIGGMAMIFSSTVMVYESAKLTQVRSQCAVFGDGQYASGANKFMRSPFPGKLDIETGSEGLAPFGTQGYRHSKMTNVAWGDGSAGAHRPVFTITHPSLQPNIAPGTGFLSRDNSAYRTR